MIRVSQHEEHEEGEETRRLSADVATIPAQLNAPEAELQEQICLVAPPETWQRYEHLLERRCAELLTELEQQELIAISDQIEVANARRLEHLAALAQLRGATLQQVMDDLGVSAGSRHTSPDVT